MENNRKWIIVGIILIIGILVGIGGYAIVDNFKDNNTQKNKEQNEEKVPLKDLSEKEISDLMDIANELSFIDLNDEDLEENYKIDNQYLLDFALRNLSGPYTLYDDEYNLDDINKVTNKYFGISITPENVLCPQDGEVLFIYNSKTKKFTRNEGHGGHGLSMMLVENLYQSGGSNGDIYTLKVKKAFSEGFDIDGPYYYYATYKDAAYMNNPVFEVIYNNNFEAIKPISELAKENEDKLNEFTYTFKKLENNYVLLTYKRG